MKLKKGVISCLIFCLGLTGCLLAEASCNCSAPGCSCSATCNPPTPNAWCSCDPPPCQCGCYAKPPVEPPKAGTGWNWTELADAMLTEISLSDTAENVPDKLEKAGLPAPLLALPRHPAWPPTPWRGTVIELLRHVAAHSKGKVVLGGIPILPEPRSIDPAKTPLSLHVPEAIAPVIFVMVLSFYDANWTFLLEANPDKTFELNAAKISLADLKALLQIKVES
ncbi:MAG TPA: hypothetical protein PLN27_17385 [Acidobacteriota bacterium]|nr:hypothetical protein [Acidobacteriota bacterium]